MTEQDLPRPISPSEAQQHLNTHLARFARDGQIAEPVIIHDGEGQAIGALIPVSVYERFLGFYEDPEIGPILRERQVRAVAKLSGLSNELARAVLERAEAGEVLSFAEAQALTARYGYQPELF